MKNFLIGLVLSSVSVFALADVQQIGNWEVSHQPHKVTWKISNASGDSLRLICEKGKMTSHAVLGGETFDTGNTEEGIFINFDNSSDRVLIEPDWERTPKLLVVSLQNAKIFNVSHAQSISGFDFDNAGGEKAFNVSDVDVNCK